METPILHFYLNSIKNEPNLSIFDTLGNSFFKNKLTRVIIKTGREWGPIFDKLILFLIIIMAFMIRQFAVIRYEALIHEFDPYFNLRTTEYLLKNGYEEFWNWFDDESWYPLGRPTGHTVYPGLMMTSHFIYIFLNKFGYLFAIKLICVYIAPIFSGCTAIIAYLISKEITNNNKSGLLSAFFTAISPSYLSRSVAGSYDNEAVAIFALTLSFYTYIYSIKRGSLYSSLLCAFSIFYMILCWGGYIFVINIIAVYTVIIILLNKFTYKEHISYTIYYIILTILLLNIPFVGFHAIKSAEHMGPHGVLILSHVYIFVKILKENLTKNTYSKILTFFAYFAIFSFLLVFITLSTLGISKFSSRVQTLLDPTHSTHYEPLIASISEHQSPAWIVYSFDLSSALLFCPLGLYLCLKSQKNTMFFMAIYLLFSLYFSGIMIRLILVSSPAVCILAGIGVTYFVENFMNFIRPISLFSYIKLDNNYKNKLSKIVKYRFSPIFSLIAILFVGFVCLKYAFHCTWASSHAYSHPSIVHKHITKYGDIFIQDDFREAYTWLQYNTHPKSRIISWWDYGYQTSSLANRTVLVDNNTWNSTHIATVGLAFALDEENAYHIMRKLDVDYVLVVFGGLIGYQSDDINKFLWMIRIAQGDFPSIQEAKYYGKNGQFAVNSDVSEITANSLLFKLCYFRFVDDFNGFDRVRNALVTKNINNLTHFEEAYTTENFVVRIYKVLPEPNRVGFSNDSINEDVKQRILKDSVPYQM